MNHSNETAGMAWMRACGIAIVALAVAAAGGAIGLHAGQTALPASSRGAAASTAVTDARADADRLQRKLESIVRFGAIPRLQTQSTVLHEREVNAYVWTYLAQDLPAGVTNPRVEIVGDSVLRGSVVLDMDAYKAGRAPSQGIDPLALLSGRLTARVRGRLITNDGVGRFELDQADLGGVPLPPFLVQRLLSHFSSTPDQPGGIRLDEPFYLPVSIREIRVEPREAVVVQ